jgi:hypothetical protein
MPESLGRRIPVPSGRGVRQYISQAVGLGDIGIESGFDTSPESLYTKAASVINSRSSKSAWSALPKNPSKQSIKQIYRKESMKLHPDYGGTPEQFQSLQSSYKDVLRRYNFDSVLPRLDARQAPKTQGKTPGQPCGNGWISAGFKCDPEKAKTAGARLRNPENSAVKSRFVDRMRKAKGLGAGPRDKQMSDRVAKRIAEKTKEEIAQPTKSKTSEPKERHRTMAKSVTSIEGLTSRMKAFENMAKSPSLNEKGRENASQIVQAFKEEIATREIKPLKLVRGAIATQSAIKNKNPKTPQRLLSKEEIDKRVEESMGKREADIKSEKLQATLKFIGSDPVARSLTDKSKRTIIKLPPTLSVSPAIAEIFSLYENNRPIPNGKYGVGKSTISRINPPSKKHSWGSVSVRSEFEDGSAQSDVFDLPVLRDRISKAQREAPDSIPMNEPTRSRAARSQNSTQKQGKTIKRGGSTLWKGRNGQHYSIDSSDLSDRADTGMGVRFAGRNTGILVDADSRSEAISKARKKKKRGGDKVEEVWTLTAAQKAQSAKGAWVGTVGRDERHLASEGRRGQGPKPNAYRADTKSGKPGKKCKGGYTSSDNDCADDKPGPMEKAFKKEAAKRKKSPTSAKTIDTGAKSRIAGLIKKLEQSNKAERGRLPEHLRSLSTESKPVIKGGSPQSRIKRLLSSLENLDKPLDQDFGKELIKRGKK